MTSVEKLYREAFKDQLGNDMTDAEFRKLTREPIRCANRMYNNYIAAHRIRKENKHLVLVAAASLAYGAYGLDEESHGAYLPSYWLFFVGYDIDDITPSLIKKMITYQSKLFKEEGADVCRYDVDRFRKSTSRSGTLLGSLMQRKRSPEAYLTSRSTPQLTLTPFTSRLSPLFD